MNHILIYEDEVTNWVYQSYLELEHVEVHDGYIKFYTIDPQEVNHEQD